VFVGDGPRAEELAQKYPEAKMLGWKGPDEVRDLMRNAKALVFPSLWFEGQPLTVLEAKALGTPVVVSDGCAGREEIADGRSGLWFESANVDALAAQLEKLKDDAFVTQMSNAAYDDFWADPLTLERHVGRIVAIYQDMIERRAGGKQAA
jgi:glycosyltransferase involved in cell wall biosynthesis